MNDKEYPTYVVQYEYGFVIKFVDYINKLDSNNRITSVAEWRFQIWCDNALFFDSFTYTREDERTIFTYTSEDFIDAEKGNFLLSYQHELQIDNLVSEALADETYDLGAKTHDIDGFALHYPEGVNENPYDITHYDNKHSPTLYWDASCESCSGYGKIDTDRGGTYACMCVGTMKLADQNRSIKINEDGGMYLSKEVEVTS
tara:strand:- start:180 stop:782 length:603 start_codon:yes stop_codon:yes gene_type:complete